MTLRSYPVVGRRSDSLVGCSAGDRDRRIRPLPVMDEVYAEAGRRGIEIVAVPTREACELLMREGEPATAAILHVTC